MPDPLVELERLAPSIVPAIEARQLKRTLGRAAEKLNEIPRQAARFQALVEAWTALKGAPNQRAKSSLDDALIEVEGVGKLLENAKTPKDLENIFEDIGSLTAALATLDNSILIIIFSQFIHTHAYGMKQNHHHNAYIPAKTDL